MGAPDFLQTAEGTVGNASAEIVHWLARPSPSFWTPKRGGPRPRGVAEVRHRRERAPSVPTLDTAAFLGSPRDRSVSWEELRGRQPDVTPPLPTAPQEAVPTPSVAPVTHPSVPETLPETAPAANVAPVLARRELPASDEPRPAPSVEAQLTPAVPYDIMLGVTGNSPQYGLLGDVSGRRVAIDLNQTHTISLFGVQGGGKSYTLGTIAEMASLPIPNINVLPRPLATVIFHYSQTMDYPPEFTSMVAPNSEAAQVKALKETFGAEPCSLADVLLLAPADQLEERKKKYPGIEVRPLKFAAAELQTSHWCFLMGAVGNQATYIRQLKRMMKSLREELTLEGLDREIEASSLPDHLKNMAKMRLELASEYIDDSVRLKDEIRPGRLIIVDLRDEFIEKDEALGLFVVLLQLFADAKYRDENGVERSFNKLVVFDEAHKYIESPDLVAGLIEVVREMRHKGTSIMVASQDPPSVPVSLIELSSQVILHKFNSPAWLKHIQKANAALGSLTPEQCDRLATLEIADDRPVALVAPPCPVIDPDDEWRFEARTAASAHNAQQRVIADRHHQATSKTCRRSTARCCLTVGFSKSLPRHVVKTGKTTVLTGEQAREAAA